MKKTLLIIAIIFISLFSGFSQNPDSNKIVIQDLGSGMSIKFGDTSITFSNQEMADHFVQNGIEMASENNYEGALQQFNTAFLYITDDPEIYYYRGLAYYYLDDYTNALEDFDQVLKMNDSHINALNQRAIIYSKDDKFREASIDLLRAIQIDPNHDRSYLNLGINYLVEGNTTSGCEYLLKAKNLGNADAPNIYEQYCF